LDSFASGDMANAGVATVEGVGGTIVADAQNFKGVERPIEGG